MEPSSPPEPTPAAVATTRPPRNWFSRHKILTGLAALVLVIVFAAIGGADGEKNKVQKATAPAPSAVSTTQPATEAPATLAPTEVATTPAQAPSPPAPVAKPAVYSGVGSKLLKISKGEEAMIVVISGRGSSNFAVTNLGADGEQYDLLVNSIGSYQGTRLIDAREGEQTAAFKIEATGFRWTIALKPITQARSWSGSSPLSGKGDDVVLMPPGTWGALDAAKFAHTGSSNFAVKAYGDSIDLLVNEIGRYSGEVQVPADTVLFAIDADGGWTISKT